MGGEFKESDVVLVPRLMMYDLHYYEETQTHRISSYGKESRSMTDITKYLSDCLMQGWQSVPIRVPEGVG